MNITYTPTYPILIRNSDSTYLVTYSVLITERIYRLIQLPVSFCVASQCLSFPILVTISKHLPVSLTQPRYTVCIKQANTCPDSL